MKQQIRVDNTTRTDHHRVWVLTVCTQADNAQKKTIWVTTIHFISWHLILKNEHFIINAAGES